MASLILVKLLKLLRAIAEAFAAKELLLKYQLESIKLYFERYLKTRQSVVEQRIQGSLESREPHLPFRVIVIGSQIPLERR